MNSYVKDIKAYELLDKSLEFELARKAKSCSRSRDKLILHNLRMVLQIANQYKDRGIHIDDLIQAGNLGLIRAIDKFDTSYQVRLYTYAVWWVKEAIRDLFKKQVDHNTERPETTGIYIPNLDIVHIRQDINKVITELNTNEIEIIKSYILEGESLTDLADIKGLSRQRIHSIKNRALEKIKDFYKVID
jgi:RNA polymerase sigma factor (sigma-70 family)